MDEVIELLEALGKAITPGRGKETLNLIRKVCRSFDLDETRFYPSYVQKAKLAGSEHIHGFYF